MDSSLDKYPNLTNPAIRFSDKRRNPYMCVIVRIHAIIIVRVYAHNNHSFIHV